MTSKIQIGVMGDGAHIEGGIHFYGDKFYQLSPPAPVDAETLRQAEEKLAQMPLDTIPEQAAVPDGSVLAFGHNRLFVGRREDLKALARMLKGGGTAAIGQIAAATGLGGIGKTQLASEFVHRYGQYFTGEVHWLNFADPAAVSAEVAACSRPGDGDFELDTRVRMVLSAWQSKLPRLIVFDNCEDQELLEQWRPKTGAARVLVTSRRQEWDLDLGVATLTIGVLERSESIELLQKLAAHLSDDDARAIASELGDLPLALHLAGSYVKYYADEVSPTAYLEQLKDETLFNHDSLRGRGTKRSPTKHDLHVAKTFALSYDRLNPQDDVDRIALALLARAACFAPGTPIPKVLLLKTLDSENNTIDPLDMKDGLSRILDVGLIESEAKGNLVLHRLLAVYVKNVSVMDAKAPSDVETSLIDEANRINNSGLPAGLIIWQPHLRFVTEQAMEREDETGASLCNALGYHLDSIGDYESARPYYEKALEIRKKVLGEEHPDTAGSLNNLGALLDAMGDYESARPYYEKALEIYRKVLGEEHPDTAASLNNLGLLLNAMGDYESARPCYEKALEIYRKVLGEEHPNTAISLNNLGLLLKTMGDYEAALPYLEKALEICRKVLGEEHPNTAASLNNLGLLLKTMGDYESARPCYEKALEIYRKVLGEEHPDTAASLNSLGALLQAIGDYEAAQPCYEKALEVYRKVLGEEHPNTALSLNNLGALLDAIGDYESARPYLEKALEIYRKVLGEEHPDTAASLNNMGGKLEAMGDYEGARPYLEKALEIRKKVLGEEHPDTARSLDNLGRLLQAMGDYEGARPYLEKALEIRKKVLGEEHPDTADSLNNLGGLLAAMGDYGSARPYYEKALEIRKKILGEANPDTAQSLNNMAVLCYYENNLKEAAKLMQQALAIGKKVLGKDHPHTRSTMESLAEIEKRLK